MKITKLKPDFYFEKYSDITKDWLLRNNIRTVLSDLDGTLVEHNQGMDKEFEDWYENVLQQVDCTIIIASNNTQERVDLFTNPKKLVGYGKCSKPFGNKITQELILKGLNPETTLFLGDQVFTDIWIGKKLGMKTALVKPLGEYEPMVTKVKRGIEKMLLKWWGLNK